MFRVNLSRQIKQERRSEIDSKEIKGVKVNRGYEKGVLFQNQVTVRQGFAKTIGNVRQSW